MQMPTHLSIGILWRLPDPTDMCSKICNILTQHDLHRQTKHYMYTTSNAKQAMHVTSAVTSQEAVYVVCLAYLLDWRTEMLQPFTLIEHSACFAPNTNHVCYMRKHWCYAMPAYHLPSTLSTRRTLSNVSASCDRRTFSCHACALLFQSNALSIPAASEA